MWRNVDGVQHSLSCDRNLRPFSGNTLTRIQLNTTSDIIGHATREMQPLELSENKADDDDDDDEARPSLSQRVRVLLTTIGRLPVGSLIYVIDHDLADGKRDVDAWSPHVRCARTLNETSNLGALYESREKFVLEAKAGRWISTCLLYTSPSPRDRG